MPHRGFMSILRVLRIATIMILFVAAPVRASSYRPHIVNGVVSGQFPSAGALLMGTSANTAQLECSGTLIGCDTFVTAAHCVCNGLGSQCQGINSPASYFVFFQNAGFFSVTSVTVRSDFNFPVGDVAVLKLGAPVTGITPMPLNTAATPAFGMAGYIAGFGRTGGSNNDYGVKRMGSVTTAECSTESNVTSVCWAFNAPLGAPGAHSNTCNGDSGGPLFVDNGSGLVLAGTTSGGYRDDCLLGDESYDANMFHYHSWVESIGGADVGTTVCSDLPVVGSSGARVSSFAGTLSTNQTATHIFTLPSGMSDLRVTLNAEADVDLYLKAGSAPTTSDYDCKQDGPTGFGACAISSPAATTWYAMVVQYSGSGVYQVTATAFGSDCSDPMNAGQPCDDANACTTGDVCNGGVCSGSNVADGLPCDDRNACSNPDVCLAGACSGGTAPRVGCHAPFAAPAGVVRLRQPLVGVPHLSWRWVKGEATSISEFGAPTVSTAYDLCLYSTSGASSSILLQHHVAPGGLCGSRPCWKTTRHGFRYTDRAAANGAVTNIELHDGSDGKAMVTGLGKGALNLPPLPLAGTPAITMQLTNGIACWEASYGAGIKNTTTEYRAHP